MEPALPTSSHGSLGAPRPGERVEPGPPFSRSVGGAPGLHRHRRQGHRLRCPSNPQRLGSLPLAKGRGTCRAHPHSAHESGAEKLPPRRRRLPPGSLPTHRGGGERLSGLGRRLGPAGGRRECGRAASPGRGRSPASLHPTHWPARRGAESLLKPPRLLPRAGRGAGAGRGGSAVMCPRSRSAPTFSGPPTVSRP